MSDGRRNLSLKLMGRFVFQSIPIIIIIIIIIIVVVSTSLL